MSDERRTILQRVASGEISPEQGAELLDSVDSPPAPTTTTTTLDADLENITAIRVLGSFRTVRVEGDPSVKTAVAEGAHQVRTHNGTLIFEETGEEDNDYMLFGPMRASRRGIYINADLGGGRKFRWENKPPVLRIRMNPELPLEVELTAGSAKVRGVSGPITANLSAGAARFEDVRSPFKAYVDAGSVAVTGRFDRGESEIRCTAGKVMISLDKGSSVRIKARSNLGKISLPGGQRWSGIGGGEKDVQVGDGAGTLDLEATTGAIIVEADK